MSGPRVFPLRRSTLTVAWQGVAAVPWPPPDAESVPDAVALRPAGTPPDAVRAFMRELAAWHVDIVLDAAPAQAPAYLDGGVTAVRCSPGAPEEVAELDGVLTGTTTGIEVLAAQPSTVLRLREVCAASGRVAAVATDPALLYRAYDLPPSPEVDTLAYPRGRVIQVGRALGVPAIGRFAIAGRQRALHPEMTPAAFSFAIGYSGGLCATWEEVRECNAGFQPPAARVEHARRVLAAMEDAYARGLGAVSLDGRMIDIAFIPVAQRTLELAAQAAARRDAAERVFAGRGR